MRKVSTGEGDDYTTGYLLGFAYFKKNYRFTVLDADSRAIQHIIFTGKVDAVAVIYYIYEKSKETVSEFYKGTTKVL